MKWIFHFGNQLRHVTKHLRSDVFVARCVTTVTATSNTHQPESFHQHAKMLSSDKNFQKIFTPELRALADVFRKYNFEVRIAGGAVRDLLLKKAPQDVDLATPATPEEMVDMFSAEGLRIINRKGEEHGTVSVRVNETENFEVTTLRVDVATHGRHATVAYTKDWTQDASRRDLTINSMFLGLDGTLYDYFGGLRDLRARRVAFVGDPTQRIQEDYLRILRYFRFFGRIVEDPRAHDAATLRAIKTLAPNLCSISGERVWTELQRIIVGRHVVQIMRDMHACGLYPAMGLPEDADLPELEKVVTRSSGLGPAPISVLTSLLHDDVTTLAMDARLRVSNQERNISLLVVAERAGMMQATDKFRRAQDLLLFHYAREPQKKMAERVAELLKYCGLREALQRWNTWEPPRFPATGTQLMELNVPKGIAISLCLDWLRNKWRLADYATEPDGYLMQHVADFLSAWDQFPLTFDHLEQAGIAPRYRNNVVSKVWPEWLQSERVMGVDKMLERAQELATKKS